MRDELFVKLMLNIIVSHKNVSNIGTTLFTKLLITSKNRFRTGLYLIACNKNAMNVFQILVYSNFY